MEAVARELEGIRGAAMQPGQRAIALAHARVLDDPGAVSQHASNGKALSALLTQLRGGESSSVGKLAALRARRDVGA